MADLFFVLCFNRIQSASLGRGVVIKPEAGTRGTGIVAMTL